jgi:hypothetical protein
VEGAIATPSPATPAPLAAGASSGPAACRAYVPAEGAALRGERLTIVGDAEEGVTVRVNGEVVPLDEDRRFVTTLVLPAGEATVEVACEASTGALSVLSRKVHVPTGEWFLLGLAEGAAGLGPTIDGMTGETLYELPNELYLHGRAVAYFKGRIKGSALHEHNPFSDVRVTAHVDTGKEPRPELLRQLIDPERYYPVYGDSAEEVQDVSSRSKLYILVEADRSRLTFGNFEASLQGIELFQYQRTFFGGALEIDHELIQGHRTEVKAFAADGEAGVRHRHVVLQGTGGSMYFMRDDEILEGSERVEIVVRDEVSGARLWSVAQTRDVDYRIDYRDGRIVFDQPIPSVVDAGFRLNQNPLRTLDGHSVFVEVEYDFQGAALGEDNEAFAFQARQTFGGRVTIGGGVVAENRDGTEYRLVGGEARFKILPQTHLDLEIAHSRAVDGDHLASFDGGLTYGRVGSPDQFRAGRDDGWTPRTLAGWAAKLKLAGDVREIMDSLGDVPPAEATPPPAFLPYTFYAQFQDPQFYAGTSILEQGQTKVGGTLRWVISEQDQVKLRHDGVWSELFFGEDVRTLNRQISAVGFEHDDDGWLAGAELGHSYSADDQRRGHRDTLVAYGELDVTPRLTLIGEQEWFTEWGTNGASWASQTLITDWTDQLATTVGARYDLAEELQITATESLRWSGSNSTQVGLKARFGEDFNVYLSERFLAGAGNRAVSTTVIGGENTAIPGSRSYAEYQLDALASGESGRAVFGMDNRWTLLEALNC